MIAKQPGEAALRADSEEARAPAGRISGRVGLVLGTALFILMLWLPPPEGLDIVPWRVAAVAVLMAVFWLTEAAPIPVTALLPVVLFPTLGVFSGVEAAAPYADPIVFLFLGGFLIALAVERANLHRRIALTVLSRIGPREDLQVGGFMMATAAISMWVSNTATAALMLPVALSVVPPAVDGGSNRPRSEFATALMLAVAYGASIGGMATLIGTPPNAFLAGFMRATYGVEIGFAEWLLVGVPFSLVMLIGCWLLLTRVAYKVSVKDIPGARAVVREELRKMGPLSRMEKRVAVVFAATAALWIFRPLLARRWPELQLSDTTIAMAAALALFFVPSGERRGEQLLHWECARRVPWGVLVLFGGGLSLAAAVADSGLAEWIGTRLAALEGVPVLVLVLAVAAVVLLLTELTSNTATTATFLPIVAALAVSVGQDPLLLTIPAVLAASCAFMLPVATPPNAIVFGSGHVTIPQMVRAGLWLNLGGLVAIMLVTYLLVGAVFGS
ncbi:MAG TPA: DASS family sodium-coupled anion symporter [Gammaproteobacteria bacterium]